MKIFITFLCMIVLLTVVTAANADPMGVIVYDSYEHDGIKSWSPKADFIVYNNTSSDLSASAWPPAPNITVWPHPGMNAIVRPHSTMINTDMDMASSSNNAPGNNYDIRFTEYDYTVTRVLIGSAQSNDRQTGSFTTIWTMQSLGPPPGPGWFPGNITNSNTDSQQRDTKFTYTLIALPNQDKTGGNFTGNTKIILVVSDYKAQDFKSFPFMPYISKSP